MYRLKVTSTENSFNLIQHLAD